MALRAGRPNVPYLRCSSSTVPCLRDRPVASGTFQEIKLHIYKQITRTEFNLINSAPKGWAITEAAKFVYALYSVDTYLGFSILAK